MQCAKSGRENEASDIWTQKSSCNKLRIVCKAIGKLDKAVGKYELSLEKKHAIHGHDKSHFHIASTLSNSEIVYRRIVN